MISPPAAYAAVVVLTHLVLLAIGVWLLIIDARTHRLPNRIVLPTLGGALVLVIIDAVVAGAGWPLVRALGGLLILGGFYAGMRAARRGGSEYGHADKNHPTPAQ